MVDKLINLIKTRLGYGVVEVYTTDDMIRSFIDEAVLRVAPYCCTGNRKGEYYQVVNGECTLPFPTSSIINIYQDKPGENQDMVMNFFYQKGLIGSNSFTWTYGSNPNKVYCNTMKPSVWVEYTDYSMISLENLSDFYRELAKKLANALSKECEANIRGKFTMNGSPFDTNTSDLKSEAMEEKNSVEDTLSQQPLLKAVSTQAF